MPAAKATHKLCKRKEMVSGGDLFLFCCGNENKIESQCVTFVHIILVYHGGGKRGEASVVGGRRAYYHVCTITITRLLIVY